MAFRARGSEIEVEEALGSALVSGAVHIGERGRVNRRVCRAVGEVADGGSSQIRSLQGRDAGGAGRAGGAVIEGLVAVGDDVVQGTFGDYGFELGPGGDVHAALGDPVGLEAAGGADVEVGDEIIDQVLVGGPAGVGRVERGKE